MTDEGYIKFNCNWKNAPIDIPGSQLDLLNSWREKLVKLSLIGMYENGIGFGNISLKSGGRTFLISGSATGGKKHLSVNDYSRVEKHNFQQNSINCVGKTKASSESLSHAAVYKTLKNVGAVIHVHSMKMWNTYMNMLPTTCREITYGTPEMAFAIIELLEKVKETDYGCIVMGGHEEGILLYGQTMELAGNHLLDLYHQS